MPPVGASWDTCARASVESVVFTAAPAVAEVTVTTDLVHRYQQRLEQYQQTLHAFAAARGMQHLAVQSDADVATLMLDELRRRGLVQ